MLWGVLEEVSEGKTNKMSPKQKAAWFWLIYFGTWIIQSLGMLYLNHIEKTSFTTLQIIFGPLWTTLVIMTLGAILAIAFVVWEISVSCFGGSDYD